MPNYDLDKLQEGTILIDDNMKLLKQFIQNSGKEMHL